MSKQDRQGVRTPADLERKYDFGKMSGASEIEKINQFAQEIAQFEAAVSAKIAEINNKVNGIHPVGSIYIGLEENSPSAVFGGTWELLADGYLLLAPEETSEIVREELSKVGRCYIWKRTS